METYGIEKHGIIEPKAVYRNLTPAQLTEAALRLGEGSLSNTGALVVTTGKSEIRGIEKLTYKETDRLKETINLLTELGGNIKLKDNTLIIQGQTKLLNKSSIIIPNDHRLLMMVVAISSRFSNPIKLINTESINKSYPNFINDYEQLRSKK